jgi:hypothetical protein
MPSRTIRSFFPAFMIILIVILACNIPGGTTGTQPPLDPGQATLVPGQDIVTDQPPDALAPVTVTSTAAINHVMQPGVPSSGKLVYDVESQGTAPERRAPYGDSYKINRLERPFLQDMTYVADLDIVTYTVGSDTDWWYVSIELIGSDPNNELGINYGVELDQNHDGFGDYIVWARPGYTTAWETTNVQIFQDKNHDTGGLSGENDDAPITTDGYETRIFNGGNGDADPDMAWVRTNGALPASIQFAFKKSWAGTVFMLGVLADAGLKDVQKLDYVDRFTEAEAGSPVKDKTYYPLKALFAVDNACREAFGFSPTGFEPQLCPRDEPPPRKPHSTPSGCVDPGNCPYGWAGEPFCLCIPG